MMNGALRGRFEPQVRALTGIEASLDHFLGGQQGRDLPPSLAAALLWQHFSISVIKLRS